MKIYRPLKWITLGNLVLCFITFYGMDKVVQGDSPYLVFNTVIGWIFWLGIFSFIAPLFFSDEKRAMIMRSPYLEGTIIICLINLLGTLWCCFFVESLFPVK